MTETTSVFKFSNNKNVIDKSWKWTTSNGSKIFPSDMETSHLFYTLRMLWNNFMPERMSVGMNIKRYRFNYSDEYIKEAIINVGNELFSRDDISYWQMNELKKKNDKTFRRI